MLLLLLACAPPPVTPLDGATSTKAVGGNSYTLTDDAPMPDDWVLERALGLDCADVSAAGWRVTPLFGGGSLPPGLARFCRFTRLGGAAADLSSLGAVPDLAVVAPLTEGTPDALAGNYAARVGAVPDWPVVPTLPARLTLVDTIATHASGDPTLFTDTSSVNPHGLSMALLAQRALCDEDLSGSPACGAELATQLGLGLSWDGSGFSREPAGGNFGSQAGLARAIFQAVSAWDAEHQDGEVGPLVLSLALGWHPEAGGSGALDAPAAAVKAVLTYASCKDVLVLAAVGNIDTPTGSADQRGPLYPAGWEVDAAPSAAECSGSTWDVPDPTPDLVEPVYRPLIYGVSGLDESLRTLANQRPGARTLHAGPATQASTWSTVDGDWMTPVSGTSVATTSVAAAAAVVRSHAPDLSAHDTMRLLRDSGASLDEADHCYDPEADGCDAARSVSVCDALVATCTSGLTTCESTITASFCGPVPAVAVLEAGDVGTTERTMGANRTGRCGSGRYVTDATRVRYACPAEQLYAAVALPMTLPQPSGGECPWCPATQPDRVDLFGSGDLGLLRNATVSVTKTTSLGSSITTHYPLGTLSGTSQTVHLPDLVTTDAALPLDGNVTAVVLSYTYAGGSVSFTEPLPMTWAP